LNAQTERKKNPPVGVGFFWWRRNQLGFVDRRIPVLMVVVPSKNSLKIFPAVADGGGERKKRLQQ